MNSTQQKVIRSTSARAFRACPRLYFYQYVEGYSPVDVPETLSFGTAWHRLLEAHLTGKPVPTNFDLRLDEHQHAKLMAMFTGYKARWTDTDLEIITVEAPYEVVLTNPTTGRQSQLWRHQGRIDAIARDAKGKLCIVEHKTTSEDMGAGSAYWKKLRLDQQVSNYFAGARSLGYDAEYCLYNVARKPALRPYEATPADKRRYTKGGQLDARQHECDESPDAYCWRCVEEIGTAPDKYFARGEVVRIDTEMADAAFDLWQTAKMIRNAELAGRWPRNPDACTHWGRECSFFPICCGEASLEDSVMFRKEH